MSSIPSAVRRYLEAIRAMARYGVRSPVQVALRVAYIRLRYRKGPEFVASFGFLDKPVRQVPEYIDGNERRLLQASVSPKRFRHLEEDKTVFRARCLAAGVRTCPVLAVIAPEGFTGGEPGAPVVRSGQEFRSVLAELCSGEFILKRCRGGKGYGIYRVLLSDGVPHPPQDRVDEHTDAGIPVPRPDYTDADSLYHWLRSLPYSSGVWMLQPRLRPHHDLVPLMPGPGLGTVRIHTFLDQSGQVHLRWPSLKIPGEGSVSDNFRRGFGGSAAAPIDPGSGVLEHGVVRAAPAAPVQQLDHHPPTGIIFRDCVIPRWEELKEAVERAARCFPELPTLGWDVAVTPDGPVMLEANWMYGSDGIQAVLGYGIRGELTELFRCLAPSRPWNGAIPATTGTD